MPQINGLGSLKATPDGTEFVPIQETGGTSRHTTVGAMGPVYSEVSLSVTDLTNLATTPVQVVPAPASGNSWWVVTGYAACRMTSGAWIWANSGTTHGPEIYWGAQLASNKAGIFPCDPFSGQVGGSDWVSTFYTGANGFPESFDFTKPPNQPINVGIASGNVTPLNTITAVTVAAGGSGYAVNDTGAILGQAFGSLATYTVTGVSGSVVTSVSFTANSGAYTTASNPHTTSVNTGGGNGALTLNITSITAVTGFLKIGLYTRQIVLP